MAAGFGPVPSVANAQQARLPHPVRIPEDAVRIPCCRCLDGSRQPIEINTRTAAWKVAGPGSSNFQPVAADGNQAWWPVPPAGWVSPPGHPQSTGDYTYQLQFYIPPCIIPSQVVISGRFAADNRARVFLDQQLVASSQGTPDYGFLQGSVTPFNVTVTTPGLHSLRVVVTNTGGVTGMVMQATIVAICPRDLELSDLSAQAAPHQIPDMHPAEPR
ncbi:MAG: hypothetical protein JO276_17185 [Sphingomonadaceae bacterium]|nr:hypothetical protein [Sphingomonadaceae bacterium]